MRRLCAPAGRSRLAGRSALGRGRVELHPAVGQQLGHRQHAGAGEVRHVVDALERLPGCSGTAQRQSRRCRRGTPRRPRPRSRGERGTDRAARAGPATGTASTAATIRACRRSGKIASRNAKVSGSMIRTSKKLIVIQRMSNLNRDSTMMSATSSSDSAAANAGRRSSTSQKPLSAPQVSRNSAVAEPVRLRSAHMHERAPQHGSATIAATPAERERASQIRISTDGQHVDDVRRASWSKPLDQAGVDQQPVEAPRLRAVGAAIEQAVAALQDALLLGERRRRAAGPRPPAPPAADRARRACRAPTTDRPGGS